MRMRTVEYWVDQKRKLVGYRLVPHIDTIGTFNFLDCMSNFSRAVLYIGYKQVQGVEDFSARDMFYAGQRGIHMGLKEGHRARS